MKSSTLEIINNATLNILEEATLKIMRSGFSTIVKESRDISVSLHDTDGTLLAQPLVQPVHLGNLVAQVGGVISRYGEEAKPGDCYVVNHPYEDCQNHASDVTLITPIFFSDKLVAWAANTAHKPDVGGKTPGSNAGDATDTIQEGLLIPPLPIIRNYDQPNHSVWEILRANTRVPELTLGDVRAQIGANFVIEQQIRALADRYSISALKTCWYEWINIGETVLRQRICDIFPAGRYSAYDYMDDDGVNLDRPYRMAATIERVNDTLHFYFDSDLQALGPINFRPCMSSAVAFYCTKAIFAPELPNNAGFQRPLKLHFPPEGRLVNPKYLAPLNMYSMSSHRMADVVLMAFAQALPDRVPAPASGYINGLSFSGYDEERGRTYVHYEIYVGGTGGRPCGDGVSGMDASVTNIMNSPVEAVETEFPLRVQRYEIRADSAGPGLYRGGFGIIRDYQILSGPTSLSMRSDRNKFAPQGVGGGKAAVSAQCVMNPGKEHERQLHSKAAGVSLSAGDIVSFRTPGGGGWGNPLDRPPSQVLDDVRDEYLSVAAASDQYGVVIDIGELSVDAQSTQERRKRLEMKP